MLNEIERENKSFNGDDDFFASLKKTTVSYKFSIHLLSAVVSKEFYVHIKHL